MWNWIKNLITQTGIGLYGIGIVIGSWVVAVIFWNLLVEYPTVTMGITAGIPGAVAIYYVIKDRINDFKRG